jgi:RNA polymerase sigma-70 factor (ECF subfamily)
MAGSVASSDSVSPTLTMPTSQPASAAPAPRPLTPAAFPLELAPTEPELLPPARTPGRGTDGGPSDELDLVARLRAGDEAAFVRLVEENGPSLARMARLYTSAAVADEVVQETWMAVLHAIDRFEGRSTLKTWITRILVNIARGKAQHERRHVPFSAFMEAGSDAQPAIDPNRFRPSGDSFPGGWLSFPERWDEQPEARLLASETVSVARRAIEALPHAQRIVVSLRDVEGWTSDEVSDLLAITPGNQRVLLHRGRAKVRAALEAALLR